MGTEKEKKISESRLIFDFGNVENSKHIILILA